jgi:hypothetical protein
MRNNFFKNTHSVYRMNLSFLDLNENANRIFWKTGFLDK